MHRGEYYGRRNNFGGIGNVDSVGGTTYGGTGVYGAQVGGVWDALLGEGRNWWFFAQFRLAQPRQLRPATTAARRRTSTRASTSATTSMVRNGEPTRSCGRRRSSMACAPATATSPAANSIDRLAFVACVSYPAARARARTLPSKTLAVTAALNGTDIDVTGCATMGEKLKVRPGAEIVVAIVVRDPSGTNYSPYTFDNPSLAQIGITQPLNTPVLDHIDVIRGLVTGYKTAGQARLLGRVAEQTGSTHPDRRQSITGVGTGRRQEHHGSRHQDVQQRQLGRRVAAIPTTRR